MADSIAAGKVAIVTGIAGGIGACIGSALMAEGWFVIGIGIDKPEPTERHCQHFIAFDLAQCREGELFQSQCIDAVRAAAAGRPIAALVNNAAVQRLARTCNVSSADWEESLAVNLTAPMLLAQALAVDLAASHGAILNIGSVHAQATKKEFVTYATTKAALHGLSRALAVDLGPDIRVICLAPAAVATPMLAAGFVDNQTALADLERCHALERIAAPAEVADAACFLLSDKARFFTGATLFLDGGVLSKLHDPV